MAEDLKFGALNATQSHYRRAVDTSELPITEKLRARGFRLTEKRKILLKILEEADHHLDAATLLERAKSRMGIDRATVYRTLDLLKKEGLVDELDLLHLRGGMHYYEARTDHEHFHLACFGCGQVEEVSTPLFEELKMQVARDKGFAVATTRLEIGGYCSACTAKNPISGEMKSVQEAESTTNP